MAKINNTTTFPITAPANSDLLIGTDVSNTTNSAGGESVNFTAQSIANLGFQTAWHPYDMLTPGDGNDGKFWDFTEDGATGTIQTPLFEAGYEYAVHFVNIDFAGTSNAGLEIELFVKFDEVWKGPLELVNSELSFNRSDNMFGVLAIRFPGLVGQTFRLEWLMPLASRDGGVETTHASGGVNFQIDGGAREITRMRFRDTEANNFTRGEMYLLRRREFVSA